MRRIVAAVLAVGLLASGCGVSEGDDWSRGLWDRLSPTDVLVEVGEVTQVSPDQPVFRAQLLHVFYARRATDQQLTDAGVVEFFAPPSFFDPLAVDGPIVLFLAERLPSGGSTEWGVRLAAVEDGTGLRFLPLRGEELWTRPVAEFADRVIWELVDVPERVPPGASDELRLMAAWVQEIAETKKPERNWPIDQRTGPITMMYDQGRNWSADGATLVSWSFRVTWITGGSARTLAFDGLSVIAAAQGLTQQGRLTPEGAITLRDHLGMDLTYLPDEFTGPQRFPGEGLDTEVVVVLLVDGKDRTYRYHEFPHPVMADLDQFLFEAILPLARCQSTEWVEVIEPCDYRVPL